MEYNELIDEYIRLQKEMLGQPPPVKPDYARPGQSWTTKKMRKIIADMELIVQQIELQATKEFYLEVDKRLND